MTREEAIKTLHELWRETNDPWYEEVYNMAIEALKADTVPIHEDGTLEVKVPNAQKVGRVLVMNTDSHIGGGLFYPELTDAVQVVRCKDCKHYGEMDCQIQESFYGIKDFDFCSYGERKGGDTE